eukprot:Filipodium_phascolosomae@DN620_c0_g1_i2.p1
MRRYDCETMAARPKRISFEEQWNVTFCYCPSHAPNARIQDDHLKLFCRVNTPLIAAKKANVRKRRAEREQEESERMAEQRAGADKKLRQLEQRMRRHGREGMSTSTTTRSRRHKEHGRGIAYKNPQLFYTSMALPISFEKNRTSEGSNWTRLHKLFSC